MDKNRHAIALSRLGASKGGYARAAKMTPEERAAGASRAASERWRRWHEAKAAEKARVQGPAAG